MPGDPQGGPYCPALLRTSARRPVDGGRPCTISVTSTEGVDGQVNRRSFLAGGLRVGTTAWWWPARWPTPPSRTAGGASPRHRRGGAGTEASAAPARRTSPPPGWSRPVGVDPDEVRSAWHVADPGGGAVQQGVPGGGHRAGAGSRRDVWDSGPGDRAGAQAFVAYAGPALEAATRSTAGRCSTADAAGLWSQPSPRPPSPPDCAPPTGRPCGCAPARPSPGQEEYSYLRHQHSLPHGTGGPRHRLCGRRPQVPAVGQRQAGGQRSELLLPRRAVLPGRRHHRGLRAGRTNAIGILHHWYGPGQGRPASAPGLLVQVSSTTPTEGWSLWCRTVRGEPARPSGCPAPQRNNDGGDFVEWIDGRSCPGGLVEGRTSMTGRGHRPWCWARWAPRPSSPSTPNAPASPKTPVAAGLAPHAWPAARWWPTSARSMPAGPSSTSPRAPPATSYPCMWATPSTRTDRSPPPTTPRAPTCPSRTPSGPGRRPSEPSSTSGFRYLQIDDPGEALGPGPGARPGPARRHARVAGGHLRSVRTRARRGVGPLCPLRPLLSQEQFVDTPTREKGQFVWDSANESQTVMRTFGDQNMSWQGLRDMARAQARYWPTTGQVNEVYPNDDGAQDYPDIHRPLPRVGVALLPVDGGRRHGDRTPAHPHPTVGLPGRRRRPDHRPDLRAGPRRPTATTSTATTTTPSADTNLNILSVNAFRRIGQVAELAGDRRRRPSSPSGPLRWPPPSTPTWWAWTALCGRPAGRRDPEPARLTAGQPGRSGLRGGAARRCGRRWPPTLPPWTSRWSPITAWSC